MIVRVKLFPETKVEAYVSGINLMELSPGGKTKSNLGCSLNKIC